MCYNVSYLEKRAERVAKHYGAHFKPEDKPLELFHANGFTHPMLNVITSETPKLIQQYQWGLMPHWCRDKEQASELANRTLNARAETVFEKASFKKSIIAKRCQIIVSGFYEWQTVGKHKYPYYISLKNRPFFSIGGVYDSWTDKQTGEIYYTFSIITVDANDLMTQIHNSKKRMPLILSESVERKWIEQGLAASEIQRLMQPLIEEPMQAYTVSKLITDKNRNTNVSEVLKPYNFPELSFLNDKGQ